jgi:hypothetical protein
MVNASTAHTDFTENFYDGGTSRHSTTDSNDAEGSQAEERRTYLLTSKSLQLLTFP